ncbi:MAG: cytochrome P450, partial [Acidimicrobiia bacterium]|nr:cytochrome P450 [Acidimicrobiia bacterium]
MPPRIAPEDPQWWLDGAETAYAWLRAEDPVHRWRDGHWVVAGYDDIRTVSRDPARFSSAKGVLVNDPKREPHPPVAMAPSILEMDPPEHPRYRKIVSRAFTPRAVTRLEPRIRALTQEVFDAAPTDQGIDFVDHIAAPLPLLVIAELLGMQDVDQAQFRAWSDETIKAADAGTADMSVVGEFVRYLAAGIADHRTRPREDILQLIVDAEVDGERLSDGELIVFCMSLLVAGNETTRNLVSGGTVALAEHPEQRAYLVTEPEARSAHAVEEMLRWVTPVKAFARTATADTELAGREIAAGDYVVLLYASGNRDPSAFGPTADRFDISRT